MSIILQKDMLTLMVFSVTDENVYFYLCLLVEIMIFDKLFCLVMYIFSTLHQLE